MISSPSPQSGDDTYELIDDAVTNLAQRRGLWLGDDLTMIALIVSLTQQAQRWLPQLVHDARTNGHTWYEIAHALGASPDDARLRYDPDLPVADSRWHHDPNHAHQPRQVRSLLTNIRGHFTPTQSEVIHGSHQRSQRDIRQRSRPCRVVVSCARSGNVGEVYLGTQGDLLDAQRGKVCVLGGALGRRRVFRRLQEHAPRFRCPEQHP